jgi:hypothetical protein
MEKGEMGLMGGGSSPTIATPTVQATKAPSMADGTVQNAYAASKKRYAAAGTKTTILTSGSGASGAPATAGKTLLGQ